MHNARRDSGPFGWGVSIQSYPTIHANRLTYSLSIDVRIHSRMRVDIITRPGFHSAARRTRHNEAWSVHELMRGARLTVDKIRLWSYDVRDVTRDDIR